MQPRALRITLAALLSLGSTASAVDPAFKLLKEDEKVNVYSRDGRACGEGADVLFVVENKTKERLELKMQLLSQRIRNNLTVVVEPSSNTSVLSMSPDAAVCGVELVDMQVNSLTAPAGDKPAVPATASTGDEPRI